jgi:AP-1 complex subunit beta-1
MNGPRFFTAPRKGENFELRADLNSEYRDRRKDAIKRVIANMTVGKDVSGLFPDVLKNMQTDDLEQKKLVYLYLMNYAKTQPELVILAVNTFVKVGDIARSGWGSKACCESTLLNVCILSFSS